MKQTQNREGYQLDAKSQIEVDFFSAPNVIGDLKWVQESSRLYIH